jgi:hypothetical protein
MTRAHAPGEKVKTGLLAGRFCLQQAHVRMQAEVLPQALFRNFGLRESQNVVLQFKPPSFEPSLPRAETLARRRERDNHRVGQRVNEIVGGTICRG